jgi:hypothetical protein
MKESERKKRGKRKVTGKALKKYPKNVPGVYPRVACQ